ncbi:hypothetical protein niasHT_008187 [Heterodera trifolii]|uniref:RING-type domain-containing protein n=1 Tax=Heterodera trifolii TaxID=157864 RepID=A0ABD2LW48_9BILA
MKIVQFSIFLFVLVFFDIIKLSEQREGAVRKFTNKIKDAFIGNKKNESDRPRSKKIDRTRSSRKKKEDGKIEGDCSICMEKLESTKKSKELPCKHGLHLKCLDELKKSGSNKCPVCRANVDTGAPEGAAPPPLQRTNSAPAHLARNGRNNSLNQSGGFFPAELPTHSPVEWHPTQWAGGDGFESDDEQLARQLHAQEFGRSEGMVHQMPMPHYGEQPPPQFHQMPMPHYGGQPPPQFHQMSMPHYGRQPPQQFRPIQMAHYGGPPASQFQHNAPSHNDNYDPYDYEVRDMNPGSGYNAGDMAIDAISGLVSGAVRLGSALLSAGTQTYNDHYQQNNNGRHFPRSTSYRY